MYTQAEFTPVFFNNTKLFYIARRHSSYLRSGIFCTLVFKFLLDKTFTSTATRNIGGKILKIWLLVAL